MLVRLALVVAIFVAANLLTLTASSSRAAVRVGGEAYGLAVGNPATAAPGAAYIQLPPEGGQVSDTSPGAGFGIGNVVASTTTIADSTTGDLGSGNVTSVVTMADGELLGGVVRARDIRVVATTTQSGGRSTAAAQVTFGSLIVAGISYPDPRPNQRIDVPGVGTVIVNEQLLGGDGLDSAAVIARAVRVVIGVPSLLDLPRGSELILAHAAAGVPDVTVSRPVAAAPTATATEVPWAAIRPFAPVSVSLDSDFDNENFSFDNGNDNGGGGGTSASPTTVARTTTPIGIVITVVVVPGTATATAAVTPTSATPTATPTSTSTPTRTPTP